MKQQLDKLKTIVQRLGKVTDEEHEAISKRAFDQVASLASLKESLLAEFDEAASAMEGADINDALLGELETIRAKASENAAILKASAQGVKDARARLKKIRESEMNSGVYGRDGAALRQPDASTVKAQA